MYLEYPDIDIQIKYPNDMVNADAPYRTSSPSGPLPCLSFRVTTMRSRATGIADHVLPLGDLLYQWNRDSYRKAIEITLGTNDIF